MWTASAVRPELRAYAGTVWRVVESQHVASTMRLADDLEDQALLEQLVDAAKPPVPDDAARLDYLLMTPFRHGRASPWPSRFRRAHAPQGVFYAAGQVETSLAEKAFYALLFLARSPDMTAPRTPVGLTAFSAAVDTSRSINLMRPPFDTEEAVWRHPTDYAPCHALADEVRAADGEIICYASARDAQARASIAVLTPAAFAARSPTAAQTWRMRVARTGVLLWAEVGDGHRLSFPTETFARDPRLKTLQ